MAASIQQGCMLGNRHESANVAQHSEREPFYHALAVSGAVWHAKPDQICRIHIDAC